MSKRLVSRRDFLKITGTGLVGAGFLGVTGCGGGAGGGGSGASLTLGHFLPEQHSNQQNVFQPLADDLAEASDGQFEVTIYPGGALGPPDQQYENVVAGVMDIGFGLFEYTPGRFPLQGGMQLPFLFEDAEQGTRAIWEAYESVPEFAAEMDDVKVLGLWASDVGLLYTVSQPVETIEDLQGLRIRAPGPITSDLLEALGASPMSSPASEAYDILERGVADGLVIPPSAMVNFGLTELVRHVTPIPFYVSSFFLVMNQQTFEGLPSENQQLIDENSGIDRSMPGATAYEEEAKTGIEALREAGAEFHQPSEAELARWQQIGDEVIDNWITEMEEQGLPGRDVYQTLAEVPPTDDTPIDEEQPR